MSRSKCTTCPRDDSGSLATPGAEHLEGCPEKGKRSGRSGKPSAEAIARSRAKEREVKARLHAAAERLGCATLADLADELDKRFPILIKVDGK